VAPFAYSQIVWANLFSVTLLAQVPDTNTVAGSVLILIAGAGAARAATLAR
jgi:drug/metabolite transporter (DMT)-like permease